MLLSRIFTKTAKETKASSASVNAEVLVRAGFIHKTMAGAYSYLPLGNRVLRKIENIVREEMDTIGNEVFLTALCPQENWQKTGRLDRVDVLFQASGANAASKKNNPAEYVLCGTHEEIITPLVGHFVQSYQDLPCAAYQIQTKFRNEARPKSGILRGREFRMKDLYSFHATEEDMTDYFKNKATPAYERVVERLGLKDLTVKALASGGSFSKQHSLEFQTRCPTGEDLIFRAPGSDVCFNREIAPVLAREWNNSAESEAEKTDVTGKGIIGVEELAAFLKIEVERTTKTLIFEADDGRIIAAAVRGEYDVNEEKLRSVSGASGLRLASADTVRRVTGAEVGYAGPLNLPPEVEVYWDDSCRNRKNFECGANKTDEHSINVNFGRDLPEPATFHDIKIAREGDLDPVSGSPYESFKASEIGNLFTLYTKFSSAFDFSFVDKDGSQKPVYMGCYGIGTTRLMGVIAELFSDEHGLKWPPSIAPYAVHIVPIAKNHDDEAYVRAIEIHDRLERAGIDCLLDDRLKESVGSKMADADLIGTPLRIVVSVKTLAQEQVELKIRESGAVSMIAVADIENIVRQAA